ncbi:MAG TPA: alanine racemase [Clostridiales bacterium]|nr:alanine racemase [Clostridiales bacterium]
MFDANLTSRSYAKIDLNAICHNFDELKSRLSPNVLTMAIVKADAYSHGVVQVTKTLSDKVDYFGVAVVEEAIELRENGIDKPILILSHTLPHQYPLLLEYDIVQTVSSYESARLISETAQKEGKTAKIHIALDTGMNRLGFEATDESVEQIREIAKLPNVYIEGLFSHYACADASDKTAANEQTAKFKEFIAKLETVGVNIPIKHICNSAGIIDLDEHFDMVRMGIALYGMYPSETVNKAAVNLVPAMEIVSHIVHIHTVPKGTPVGYGYSFITERETKIATIGIGYADGYSRSFSNKGYVLINGNRANVIGRVCMDLCTVDVTDIDDAEIGSHVIIMGKSGNDEISAEMLGELSGSFNYEVICGYKKRVARVYVD